jgi:hypothetical protein
VESGGRAIVAQQQLRLRSAMSTGTPAQTRIGVPEGPVGLVQILGRDWQPGRREIARWK